MKTQRISHKSRGFTIMELMVAMAITTIIVTVLVTVTSIALDTWNRSRSELRASRQAKTMIDTLTKDFESMVVRRGNSNEWLSAVSTTGQIGDRIRSTNAVDLIFYTAVTDRYDGNIGPNSSTDKGGDVSCVGYKLSYRDPVSTTGGSSKFETFVLNRLLLDPDETFTNILGENDLVAAFGGYGAQLNRPENFVCENVFQFTITFHVQVAKVVNGNQTYITVPVTVGRGGGGTVTSSFSLLGTGIDSSYTGDVTADELKTGKMTAMEVSLTVLSDYGIDQLKTRTFSTPTQQADFLAQNSYQFSKLVQLPAM